jgi:hypothetical protein
MVRDLSPEEISYLATSFAVALTKDLDRASIKVMCSFFVSVVSSLNLIIAQRGLLKEPSPPPCGGCGEPPRN